MKRLPFICLFLLFLLFLAPLAGAQEGSITTPETISPTKIRIEGVETQRGGGSPYMVLTLSKVTDSDEVVEAIVIQIRNGSTPETQWLDGTGAGTQPVGIETEMGSALQPACDPASDAAVVRCQSALGNLYGGAVMARKNKALMHWLKTVGKPAIDAGAEGITAAATIPEFGAPTP